MPKIRLGDLLNVVEPNTEVRISGYYTKISYDMEDVASNYLKRFVIEIKTSMNNYNPILDIYFEDELD